MATILYGKHVLLVTVAAVAVTLAPVTHAAPSGPVTATVCNAGACAPIPPEVAVVVFFSKNIIANIQAAGGESGELAKVLRGATGISVRDIQRYGIFGGECSIFRRPLGC